MGFTWGLLGVLVGRFVLGVEFSQEDLTFLQQEQNRKIEKKEDMVILSKSKLLEEHFSKMPSKKERNCIIYSAYWDGYSQIEIGTTPLPLNLHF